MGGKGTKRFAFQGSSLTKLLEDGFSPQKGIKGAHEGRAVPLQASQGLTVPPVAAPWEPGVA